MNTACFGHLEGAAGFQDVMQAELATVVDNATDMTTYSWRRTGPTDETGGDGSLGRLADSVRYPKRRQYAAALLLS